MTAPAGPLPMTAHRRRLGISREQLAARAGVSPRTLYNLEHGLVRPQRATLVVLAMALGCAPDLISSETEAPADLGFAKAAETS